MVLAMDGVVQDYDPQILVRHAGQAQRDQLGDRIVLAVAGATCERHQRRGPEVGLAILREIAGSLDGEIDRAIDLA